MIDDKCVKCWADIKQKQATNRKNAPPEKDQSTSSATHADNSKVRSEYVHQETQNRDSSSVNNGYVAPKRQTSNTLLIFVLIITCFSVGAIVIALVLPKNTSQPPMPTDYANDMQTPYSGQSSQTPAYAPAPDIVNGLTVSGIKNHLGNKWKMVFEEESDSLSNRHYTTSKGIDSSTGAFISCVIEYRSDNAVFGVHYKVTTIGLAYPNDTVYHPNTAKADIVNIANRFLTDCLSIPYDGYDSSKAISAMRSMLWAEGTKTEPADYDCIIGKGRLKIHNWSSTDAHKSHDFTIQVNLDELSSSF